MVQRGPSAILEVPGIADGGPDLENINGVRSLHRKALAAA